MFDMVVPFEVTVDVNPSNFVDSTRSRELSATVKLTARSANLWWDDIC